MQFSIKQHGLNNLNDQSSSVPIAFFSSSLSPLSSPSSSPTSSPSSSSYFPSKSHASSCSLSSSVSLSVSSVSSLSPSPSPPLPSLAVAAINLAATAASEPEWRRVLDLIHQALTLSSSPPHEVHGMMLDVEAQTYLQLDQTFEAVQSATAATQKHPSWAPAHLTLGRALLEHFLSKNSSSDFCREWLNMSIASLQKARQLDADLQEAREDLARALRIDQSLTIVPVPALQYRHGETGVDRDDDQPDAGQER